MPTRERSRKDDHIHSTLLEEYKESKKDLRTLFSRWKHTNKP
jgi:hypothetical protein